MNDSSTINQLDHIMNFQLNDLRKSSICATANFLVAIGCMNTLEFLGGVSNGMLGVEGKGVVEKRFKEGVSLLGGEYTKFGKKKMYNLRNGLTHQYIPSLKGISSIYIVNNWSSPRAIVSKGDDLTLNVAKLIKDLETAWEGLRKSLQQDMPKLGVAGQALSKLPRLL
jgi:hypothetical protein